jgi:hypothetical protein
MSESWKKNMRTCAEATLWLKGEIERERVFLVKIYFTYHVSSWEILEGVEFHEP